MLGITAHDTHASNSATTPVQSAQAAAAQQPTVAAVRLPAAPYTLLPGYVSRPQVGLVQAAHAHAQDSLCLHWQTQNGLQFCSWGIAVAELLTASMPEAFVQSRADCSFTSCFGTCKLVQTQLRGS